jgi:hypothetical protein
MRTSVSRDWGAQGRFDGRERRSSADWWVVMHRDAALASAFAIVTIAALATLRHYAHT